MPAFHRDWRLIEVGLFCAQSRIVSLPAFATPPGIDTVRNRIGIASKVGVLM